MQAYESVRNQQSKIIADNSTSIVITRITRTADSAGGWTETTSTLAAQTVRIYAKNKRVLDNASGGFVTKKVSKMLALYNANIESEDETYLDKFTFDGKTYKVNYVENVTMQGQIVFKEVEIEEIVS